MKGHLHVHSMYSLNDSALSIQALLKKAQELGMTAIALTDHGTLLGADEFMSAEGFDDINKIVGVEVYFSFNENIQSLPTTSSCLQHLVLLAKNIEGYKEICNIVTESNRPENILKVNKKRSYPVVTPTILQKHITGNNVIALSACIQGIISERLLRNFKNQSKLAELISYKDFETLSLNKEKNEKTIEALQKEIKMTTDDFEKSKLQNRLDIAELNMKKFVKEHAQKEKEIEERRHLESILKPEEELFNEACGIAGWFRNLFGADNFYIELQNHGLAEEKFVADKLVKIASMYQLKTVATNDVHILSNSENDVTARTISKFNGFGKWFEPDNADRELYLKTEKELENALLQIYPLSVVKEALDSIDEISSKCHVKLEQEYHYPVFKGEKDSKELLREKALKGMYKKYAGFANLEEIIKRTEYELEIIIQMGFADYLLIVQDFLEFGRKCGHMPYDKVTWLEHNCQNMTIEQMVAFVEANQTEPGIAIGPGRGSAAGSIVCYELGITNIDPLKHDLMFERFLNPSRVSMPDIDSDFSFESRTLAIEFVRKKYGHDCVCGITTVAQAAPKGAIRLTARALAAKVIDKNGYDDKSEKAETIRKDYLQMADKIAKSVPNELNIKLVDCYDDLVQKFATDVTCKEIIEISRIVEGMLTNTGTHAAGIIIADKSISNYISLMYDTNNNVFRTQCDMLQAEGIHGLLKFDFLGLRTLSTLTFAARLVKERTGEFIDFDSIPIENDIIQKTIRKGLTSTVFQFASAFMKQIIKKIKPDTFEDMILINAIGRPGPMQFIDPIAAVKAGTTKTEYLIPEIQTVLGKTYDYPVYQEQIMELMQMAGMTLAEADNIRKYMSKKKEEKFMEYKPRFMNGFTSKRANPEKTEEFWNQLVEFAKYAFNKSHAAAYVDVAYKCAYMLLNHPVEWICASLQYSQTTEEMLAIIEDAKILGIKVLQPDVNKSKASFSIEDDHTVRFGICAIKGCGDSLKDVINTLPYSNSLAEFVLNSRFGKGILTSLAEAGALDSFSDNREAIKNAIEVLADKLDDLKKKEKAILLDKEIIEILDSGEATKDNWKDVFASHGIKLKVKNMPTRSKKLESIKKKEIEVEIFKREMMSFQIGTCYEDEFERMKKEKEALGFYLTKHPLDLYNISSEVENLNEIFEKEHVIAGVVTEVLHKKTKAAGTPIIFFTLEDKTGKQKINCWTKETENFGHFIKEDAVLEVTVDVKSKIDAVTEEITTEMKVVSIKEPEIKKQVNERYITMHFKTVEEAADFLNTQVAYIDERNGVKIRVVIDNRKIFTSNAKYNQCIAILREEA